MNRRTAMALAPLAILLIGALVAIGIVKTRAPVPTTKPAPFAPLVRFQEIVPGRVTLDVKTQGTVVPRTESSLVSEVAGLVREVSPSFASGGTFEKGDVLITIDPRDYQFGVSQAKSVQAQARLAYEVESAQAEVAREEWDDLGDGGEATPLASRALQVEDAHARLIAAEAALAKAERDLAKTRIRAPYAGRVRRKGVDVGQYVVRGTAIASIYAIDDVEVRLPIHDADLASIDLAFDFREEPAGPEGPPVTLLADFGGARRKWSGRIVRVEGEIDPVSRMVHVVARVADPYGRNGGAGLGIPPLAVGLFVEATIRGRVIESGARIPRSAIHDGDRVLLIDSDNRLRFQEVEIIRRDGEDAIVGVGLKRGDRLCLSSLAAATEGMLVRTGAIDAGDTP